MLYHHHPFNNPSNAFIILANEKPSMWLRNVEKCVPTVDFDKLFSLEFHYSCSCCLYVFGYAKIPVAYIINAYNRLSFPFTSLNFYLWLLVCPNNFILWPILWRVERQLFCFLVFLQWRWSRPFLRIWEEKGVIWEGGGVLWPRASVLFSSN